MSSPEEAAAIKRRAQERFTGVAERYVSSAILAEGAELARMVELARLQGGERVLDVATGGGHTALAFAPHVERVVASDLTPAMLDAAASHLAAHDVRNVRFEVADAEALPYAEAEFDVVSVRFAPHHFPRPERFAAEVVRVLKTGGRVVMFDNMAPEDDELDAFMNRFEAWRDPSHFRAHRSSEWQAMLTAAGLIVEVADPLVPKLYPFEDWTARQAMPAAEREALERWLLAAPRRCIDFFQVRVEHGRLTSLEATFGVIAARKA